MRHLLTSLRLVDAAAAVLLLGLVRAYQLVGSPLLGPVCRFAPSCSSYAATALRERGAVVGSWLAARRVLRCHPWAAGGWDPVPARRAPRGAAAPAARQHTGPVGPLPTRTR